MLITDKPGLVRMPQARASRAARTARDVSSLARTGNLSERIYTDLRARLQRCAIQPDERLVDVELAAAYGTSRMPAREALLRLVAEGYLTGTTRGFTVPTLSLHDIREIFGVRRLLEPTAAADAARHFDAAAVAELDAALAQARAAVKANDTDAMIQANMAFRHVWLSRVGNARLASTIARFVDHVQTVRLGTLSNPPTRRIVMDGLEGLHAVLVRRDAAKTRVRMAAFLAAAERAFFSVRQAEMASGGTPARRARARN
jgi:DNA-binding GntR family transcriptional regulator